MKRKLLALGLLLSSVSSWASTGDINALRIHCRSGEDITMMLDEYPIVRFDSNDLVITTSKSEVNLMSDDVLKFTYAHVATSGTGNQNLSDVMFFFEKEYMKVTNLAPATNVTVYTVDGMLISSAVTDRNGNASLRLPESTNSVYIVKTSSLTFKIRRP